MINTNQRKNVLVHSLRCCEPAMYIIGEELLQPFCEIEDQLGDIPTGALCKVTNDGASPGADDKSPAAGKSDDQVPDHFIHLEQAARLKPEYRPVVTDEIRAADPCFYIFTSGTTGLPKASIMSHNRWLKAGHVFGEACLVARGG